MAVLNLSLFFFFFLVRWRPQVDLEEYNFLEKIFSKTKPEERTWAKLVNLNTVHWYCDGPEPTAAAIKYEECTRQRKSVISFFHCSFALSFTRLPLFLQRWTTRRGGLLSEVKLLRTRRWTWGRWGWARADPWQRDRCLRSTVHLRNRKFRRSPS